ncbi:hypothetical protein HK098_000994 [Nowakowskiella sp. JEL0407]|nr:hypothetical protein HK098_000994 [Nowakowskiella sp. JEL0407]
MGESRTELLAWLNDLLQLGLTKVEQCGSGAAHCQIMDSIYRDVPLSKVKFNAKHEYEYIANFKVLQSTFDKHKIDNFIPVERLAKCKFQDNLEFLQWMKKYWDQYYPGGTYDAVARRKGIGSDAVVAPPPVSMPKPAKIPAKKPPTGSLIGVPQVSARNGSVGSSHGIAAPAASEYTRRVGNNQWEHEKAELEAEYQKMLEDMTQQTMELKVTIEQVEKEREFYFSKLREIEMFVQQQLDPHGTGVSELEPPVEQVLQEIQSIMYRTEDGFEVPENEAAEEY